MSNKFIINYINNKIQHRDDYRQAEFHAKNIEELMMVHFDNSKVNRLEQKINLLEKQLQIYENELGCDLNEFMDAYDCAKVLSLKEELRKLERLK